MGAFVAVVFGDVHGPMSIGYLNQQGRSIPFLGEHACIHVWNLSLQDFACLELIVAGFCLFRTRFLEDC